MSQQQQVQGARLGPKLCSLPWVTSCKVTFENSYFSLFHLVLLILLGSGTSFQSLIANLGAPWKFQVRVTFSDLQKGITLKLVFLAIVEAGKTHPGKSSACSCAAGANVTLLATLQFQTALKVS